MDVVGIMSIMDHVVRLRLPCAVVAARSADPLVMADLLGAAVPLEVVKVGASLGAAI
jgi:hypothetical protein